MAGRQGGRDRNATQHGHRDEKQTMRHRTQINNRLLGLTLLFAAISSARAFTPVCGGGGLGGVWLRAGGTQVGGSARLARPALRMSTTSNVGTSEQVQDVGRGTLMAQAGVSPVPSRPSLARSLSLPLLLLLSWHGCQQLCFRVFVMCFLVFVMVGGLDAQPLTCRPSNAQPLTFRPSALHLCAPYVLCEGNASG